MLVEQFLEQSADRLPDKVALVTERDRFTFFQIEQRANSLAHSLIASGVKRGDRVVIVLPNCVEAVIAVFAILKAGAVFVVLHSTIKGDKLAYILNDCRATAIITNDSGAGTGTGWLRESPYVRAVFLAGKRMASFEAVRSSGKAAFLLDEISAVKTSRPGKQCIDIDLAALIYTSGSTGKPKGVMMTHLNILSAASSITSYLENHPDDVVINVLPLAFDYGLYQLLMMFKVGGTLVLLNSFAFPGLVLQKAIEEGVTGFPIVPTLAALILQMDLSAYSFTKLRYITNTGAALPTEHIRQLRAHFPYVKIYSMYGLTECKRVSFLPPDQIDIRPNSVGRGMPNEEVFVIDADGQIAKPGEIGELVVRGSNVMKGYWEMDEETQICLRPGPLPGEKMLYTGDLFYTDQEGYLYFVGRRDDVIKSRGEKVSPREVEDVLCSLEGVAEAVVLGVPDPILGSSIRALVVRKLGATITQHDVLRHCASKLEDFMVPKYVEFCDSLPKTETGKVSRRAALDFKATSI